MSRPPLPPLPERFLRAADALEPMRRGSAIVLGCSAGGDSAALMELAAGAAESRDWRLAVAHFDHAQRPESAEEAAFVAERAARLGLPFISERWGRAPEGPASEDAMRSARRDFLRRAAARHGAGSAVALAHQADDRAETLLMRLMAGTGPEGLGSIRPVEHFEGLTVARPLLGFRRSELREWLRDRGIAWREDPGNEDHSRRRAWIRGALLPFLAGGAGLDPVPRIVRLAELAAEESSVLTEACGSLLAMSGDARRLDAGSPVWRAASRGLRRRLLRQWLWRVAGSAHPPGHAAVEEALAFIERGAQGSVLRSHRGLLVAKHGAVLTAKRDAGDAGDAREEGNPGPKES